jgi:hypothetical protein
MNQSTITCPSCSTAINLHAPEQTEAVGCEACGSVIHFTDDSTPTIVGRKQRIIPSSIPLGTRGTIRGQALDLIGYLRKEIKVDGIVYAWTEYLLSGEDGVRRWMSEDNGHWTYMAQIDSKPKNSKRGSQPVYIHENIQYKHFQTVEPKITQLVGEMYWPAEVGESTDISEYIAPPYLLSREKLKTLPGRQKNESWYFGRYMKPSEIVKGFGVKDPLPLPIGIASSQPSPYGQGGKKLFSVLAVLFFILITLQIGFMVNSGRNIPVFEKMLRFDADQETKTMVTDTFLLLGHTSNVVIEAVTNLDNHWMFFSTLLINDETGEAYDFAWEVSYYHGVTGGESWREGNKKNNVTIPSVPSGRYYLLLEPQSDLKQATYTMTVYRNVPGWTNFFLALLVLVIMAAVFLYRFSAFENRRWMESDHPPEVSMG